MKNISKLPETEQEVMQAVWACEAPVTRAHIGDVLKSSHPMAATTLLTILSRLAAKGFIKIDKVNNYSVYTPLISRESYLAAQSGSLFKRLCGGDVSVFAQALCQSGLSGEEIKELRRLLKEDKL